MSQDTLESIRPRDALDWYLEHREDDLRTATLRKYDSALNIFIDWTDEVDIDDMNDVQGRQLMQFKTWRKQDADLATVSLNGNLAILQRFLRFCENIDAVPEGFADRVPMPIVPDGEEVSYEVPADEEIESIKSYCRQFERASRRHVEFELIAEIGIRLGAIRAVDLQDFDPEASTIYLRDRPEGPEEYGTPLKNDAKGERIVNVSPELRDLIVDYVEHRRNDVTDRYGREPLMATSQGRPTTATIRRDFYKMSRPCVYENDCPHDRTIEDCEAANNADAADCPSRFSTHPLRKWAIMKQLDEGVPKELLSDRVDVSVPTLDKHYDHRTEKRKSERRREVLEENMPQFAATGNGDTTDG